MASRCAFDVWAKVALFHQYIQTVCMYGRLHRAVNVAFAKQLSAADPTTRTRPNAHTDSIVECVNVRMDVVCFFFCQSVGSVVWMVLSVIVRNLRTAFTLTHFVSREDITRAVVERKTEQKKKEYKSCTINSKPQKNDTDENCAARKKINCVCSFHSEVLRSTLIFCVYLFGIHIERKSSKNVFFFVSFLLSFLATTEIKKCVNGCMCVLSIKRDEWVKPFSPIRTKLKTEGDRIGAPEFHLIDLLLFFWRIKIKLHRDWKESTENRTQSTTECNPNERRGADCWTERRKRLLGESHRLNWIVSSKSIGNKRHTYKNYERFMRTL